MTATARSLRQSQIRADRATMRAITQDYFDVWRSVRADLDELNHQIAEAQAADTTISPSWLYRQDRYKALLAGIQQRVSQFNTSAAQRVYNEMLRAHGDGSQDAMALLHASLPDGVSYAFTHPPVGHMAAFEQLSRQTLGKLFAGIDREVTLKVRQALLQGIARGQAPAVITKSVRDAMSGPLWKALRISRSETLNAYRDASHDTYVANSDVVSEWEWLTGPNPCDFCASMSGQRFPLSQRMSGMTHPNDRCTEQPVTRPWSEILGVDTSQFSALA